MKQRLVLNLARNKKMRNLDDHLILLFLGRFEPALAAASFILDQGKALIQDNLGKQSIGLLSGPKMANSAPHVKRTQLQDDVTYDSNSGALGPDVLFLCARSRFVAIKAQP